MMCQMLKYPLGDEFRQSDKLFSERLCLAIVFFNRRKNKAFKRSTAARQPHTLVSVTTES